VTGRKRERGRDRERERERKSEREREKERDERVRNTPWQGTTARPSHSFNQGLM